MSEFKRLRWPAVAPGDRIVQVTLAAGRVYRQPDPVIAEVRPELTAPRRAPDPS